MYPRKGVIAKGADADLVIYDPAADHELHAADMVGKAGYTPYEGFAVRGGIQQVWLRGNLVVDHGNLLAGPNGKFIPRGKNML